jgi:lipopolysaccharide/colanic/teichoic acid biosynthesis glycosyltransferase
MLAIEERPFEASVRPYITPLASNFEAGNWVKVCPKFHRSRSVQRVIDVVFSATVLLLLLPVFFIIAVAITLDDPGPIIFSQQRIGENGRAFKFYKFRSMVSDAEERLAMLVHMNERSGPVFKIHNDPRITTVGRFLRRYSLDELPQFLNVLIGDMSLVGPRPALPREVAKYTGVQMQRLSIAPGLTGLWQVSGRANLSFDESIALDLEYMRTWSIKNNFKIILRTIPTVIKGTGAF